MTKCQKDPTCGIFLDEGSLWCHIADCGTLGLKRLRLGLKRGLDGTGWRRESQIGDLSPRTLLPTALHCIASLG